MTTLTTRLSDLSTRIATECKSIRSLINANAADLSSLTTTTKTNLVAALNELKSDFDSLSTAQQNSSAIDDAHSSADTTWSSNKIGTAISSAVSALPTINDASTSSTTQTWSASKSASSVSTLTNALASKAAIDDANTASSTTWSSTQITSQITTAINALTSGAPTALDTLKELADALGDDANFATTVTTGLGNRLRVDTATQGLTTQQQANAIANIGAIAASAIGTPDTDFVATFEAGLS